MDLFNREEFEEYITANYKCILEREEGHIQEEISGFCDSCVRDVFLKVHSVVYANAFARKSHPEFSNLLIECPNCRRISFLQTVMLQKQHAHENSTGITYTYTYQFYKLYEIPVRNESYLNRDIPLKYPSLINSAMEAEFCLKNSKFIASAILFRRAIQILAKDILGGEGKTLYNQLEWLKSNQNTLKIDLNEIFHDNAKIIKDIGNQGAHPDDDITLHEFSEDDAYGLQDLFISIMHEVFIKPKKMKALQEELKKNRKLK